MKKKSKFSKLATQLKKEGADDPKALAAYIGRKNLGAAEFMRRAAAGRKKAKRQENIKELQDSPLFQS